MSRFLKAIVFIFIFLIPLAFYFLNPEKGKEFLRPHDVKHLPQRHVVAASPAVNTPVVVVPSSKVHVAVETEKPVVAIIFDDLGENLNDIRQIYSLGVPVTVAIIPGLEYSNAVANFASRCGFSVLVHLPLQPGAKTEYKQSKYKFITSDMSDVQVRKLTNYYLNAVPSAIGVNNHMGSVATKDPRLMNIVLDSVKQKKLIFIDSRTSLDSVAYSTAVKKDIIADYNHGFIDAVKGVNAIEGKIDYLADTAFKNNRMIIIGHPRKETIAALKNKVPALKDKIRFVTLKEYFAD